MLGTYFLKLIKLLCIGVLLFSSQIKAQQSPQVKILTPAAQKEDLAWLKKALQYAHADLFYYHSEKEFTRRYNKLLQTTRQPTDALTFFGRVAAFNAAIRTNHLYTLAKGNLEDYILHLKTLPLYIVALDNGLYVRKDLSGAGALKAGSEILSLNGRSATSIIHTFSTRIPTDGAIQTGKKYFINQYHWPAYKGFDLYYALYIERPSTFLVKYKEYGTAQVKTVKLNGITYEEKSKVLQQRFGEHWPFPPPAPSYRIDSVHNMGVLSIPRSWRGEGEPKLVAIMDSVLEQMQKNHIQNLVVDIRGNPGGNDNTPAFVMGHLTKDTIQYYKSIYYRQLSFDAFKKVISTDPNEPKFDFTADAKRFKRDKEGRYWLTDAEWQGALYHYPPQRNTPFTGRVFLLATGENISAGSSFAALFKGSGRATIIGEETGSDYNFVIGGTALPIILPNSGIMVRIPTLGTRYGFKEQVKGRGTIPDITIIPTIADIIEGRDKAMETVIELIRKKAE
jgi:hypothetical protein